MPETRAVLVVRLVGFLKGRLGVRPAVVHFLAGLLNLSVTPVAPSSSDQHCLRSLAAACIPGITLPAMKDGKKLDLDAILEGEDSLTRPGLTQAELAAFVQGISPTQAVCSLGIAGMTPILSSNAVAFYLKKRSLLALCLVLDSLSIKPLPP